MNRQQQARADRLAEAVKARRRQLGITQKDVVSASGPSLASVQQIETATQPGGLAHRTLDALDRSLLWVPGSAEQIIAGGTDAGSLDTAGWPSRDHNWARFVERAQRRMDESTQDSAEHGPDANEYWDGATDPLTAASDAQLIAQLGQLNAELARRLAERDR